MTRGDVVSPEVGILGAELAFCIRWLLGYTFSWFSTSPSREVFFLGNARSEGGRSAASGEGRSNAPLVYPLSHNRPHPARRPYFLVRTSGRVLDLSAKGFPAVGGGGRSGVSAFSEASKRRMVYTCESIDWNALGTLVLVTLTYRQCPASGQESKRHLKIFRQRWHREFGKPRGMWQMEFQKRGVPHYHLLLSKPDIPILDLMAWVARAWWEVVGSGDPVHLKAGTSTEVWRNETAPGRYFGKHGTARVKAYQHVVPPGWWSGRFWGRWGVSAQWEESYLSVRQFIALRRLSVRLMRSRGRGRRSASGGLSGLWVAGDEVRRMVSWVKETVD